MQTAVEITGVHNGLLRRLDACNTVEGFATQYLWMLKERSRIETVYAQFEMSSERGAGSTEQQPGLPQSEVPEFEENSESENYERNRYRGTLSECSDPDGWVEANYGFSSDDQEEDHDDYSTPDPESHGQDYATSVGEPVENSDVGVHQR